MEARAADTLLKKIALVILSIGPGIFLIGYNIGTGSITTMASCGSRYGMSLFWALVLSCIFTFVMLTAYGKYTLVTGKTALHSFREYFPGGKAISIFLIVALSFGEISALIGIMGIVANLVTYWSSYLALWPGYKGFDPRAVTVITIIGLFVLLWNGRYSFFEKIMIIFVGIMAISFISSAIMVVPDPSQVINGLIPKLPNSPNAPLIAAAIAGTTLSAVMFVIRSIVVSEKGWTIKDLKQERRDAFVSATMMLILSATIMACGAGALHPKGIFVDKAIDMIGTLEPIAGRFAMNIFIPGIIAAALSTVFPIVLIAPWLICDYMGKERNIQSPLFRILGGIALLIGLYVPFFGSRPVWVLIAALAFQATLMPLVTIFMWVLLNRRAIMGKYRIGFWMNLGIGATFVFSMVMAYSGVIGLKSFFY